MKINLTLSVATIFFSVAAFAPSATIASSNYAGPDTSVFLDAALTQIGTGYVAVGYFDISDATILTSTASQLASAFQILGSSGGTSYDVGAGYYMNGAFGLSSIATISSGSPYIGKNIYLVVGNAASLSSSSQAFIYKTNTLFQVDPSSAVTLDFSAGPPAGTLILGTTGVTYTPYYSGAGSVAGNEVTTAYRTATLVPEPSAVLLGAFGALGLLRRRRN